VLHYDASVSFVSSGNVPIFVKFTYDNGETARKRAAYLALLTYQFKMGFFVRAFTKELIEDNGYMERYA
jgi:hypothetical protein